jgi:glycosyltransferase involved in cell wall biosynthesis
MSPAPSSSRHRRTVLVVEPFLGGSHRAFLEGLARHSAHRILRVTLPAELWRWRLRASALALAGPVAEKARRADVILASSMLDAAHLTAILGPGAPPLAVYFHESQLGYPRPPGAGADLQLGLANVASALAAQAVVFNSRFHRDDFLRRLPGFLRAVPGPQPRGLAARIRRRSRVIHPGVELPPAPQPRPTGNPPALLWNHRWEFDKNPGHFFRVCYQLAERGVDFRLILLGECSQVVPKPFLNARERLGDRILRYGRAPTRREYLKWVGRGDIVVSTAAQENFGMAVVEAVAAGCYPLLPRALSYPEVLPARMHPDHLYGDLPDLLTRLEALLRAPERIALGRADRRRAMERYGWDRLAPRFDRLLDRVSGERRGLPR